jgi:hypothetical protein
MKDTLTSKLGSFQATLAVADKDENKPIWQNKAPVAFGESLLATRTAVAGLAKAGAEQSADIGGSTDALRGMRTQFENALHPFARAAFRCLKNTGHNEAAAKVDFTPTDLRNARAVALAGIGETILNLAEPLTKSSGGGQAAPGDKYGVTAAKFAEVDELWSDYSTAVGAPASARARRKAITDALPGQFAAVEEKFAELDDLVIQFRGAEASDRFVEAWFNARRVVDTGRRAAKPNPAVSINSTSSTPEAKAA